MKSQDLLLPEERERLQKLQGELHRMRLEVESLSHQRAVVEVLSRPVISKVLQVTRGGRCSSGQRDQHQIPAASSNPAASAVANKEQGGIGVEVRDPASHIFIPPYRHPGPRRAAGSSQTGTGGGSLLARGVAGRAVLPSVSPLSAEVQRIVTQPQLVPRRARRRSARGGAVA
ncbi:hypothetical protein EON64_12605, partial [archaeon]